jgi:Zn-dependent protease
MGLTALLFKNPLMFLMLAGPLLYSIIFHELSHGLAAYSFGDKTARDSGRLSLNPFVHLDPIGTIALFLVGFGWAKPVPVNYSNLKNFRIGLIVVALSGCLANIIIATIAMFFLRFHNSGTETIGSITLLIIAKINIILGAFNLIPIPPLDGSKILMGFLPTRAQISLSRIEPYGFFVLLALLYTGLLNPVIVFAEKRILSLISVLLGFAG